MIEVRRRNRESTGALMRRFTRRVQRSRVLLKARKVRFFEPEKSRQSRRESAIRRIENRKEKDRLRKLGKLEEDVPRRRRFS